MYGVCEGKRRHGGTCTGTGTTGKWKSCRAVARVMLEPTQQQSSAPSHLEGPAKAAAHQEEKPNVSHLELFGSWHTLFGRILGASNSNLSGYHSCTANPVPTKLQVRTLHFYPFDFKSFCYYSPDLCSNSQAASDG